MLAVAIPTLNEKDSIKSLIEKLFSLPVPMGYILVIDDGSTDGTVEIIKELIKKYPQLHLLQRQGEKGLGIAYADGFRHILQNAGPEITAIIQMDADGSHNPAVIPQFLKLMENGYDLVLGSRYIPDGKIEKWNLFRRLISRFGNYYAQFILGVRIRDLTGGYKCWKRSLLEEIAAKPLNSLGYVFQIETTYRAYKMNKKIAETPITFTERKQGGSKFSLKIIVEAYWGVIKLRFKK